MVHVYLIDPFARATYYKFVSMLSISSRAKRLAEVFKLQELRTIVVSQQTFVLEDGECVRRCGAERSLHSIWKGNCSEQQTVILFDGLIDGEPCIEDAQCIVRAESKVMWLCVLCFHVTSGTVQESNGKWKNN